jgi:hypothetical protein
MSAKLTPWFPSSEKPSRAGVYACILRGLTATQSGYAHWDGKSWGNQYGVADDAPRRGMNGEQDKRWCGLASDPKASKS